MILKLYTYFFKNTTIKSNRRTPITDVHTTITDVVQSI